MTKKILISFLFILCVFAVPSIGALASASDFIENNEDGIPDKVLYQEILKTLGKNKSEKFTIQEAESISELDIRESRLGSMKTLRGIGYLGQLEKLYIQGHFELTSLEGVEHLSKLEELTLPDNGIKSLKPLKSLNNIRYLSVEHNQLSSLDGVQNLKNLESLTARWNKLTTLKGIDGKPNLKSLDLADNKLKNIAGIQGATALQSLDLTHNKIEKLAGIEKLTELSKLHASSNKLTSLKEIKRLRKLEELMVSHNKIKKLPDLRQFKKLRYSLSSFMNNCLSEKEIRKKLPSRFYSKKNTEKKNWIEDQIDFQNLKTTIDFIEPVSKNKISKNTKKIEGRIWKGAYVELKNLQSGKKSKRVKADENGRFLLERLNLKKWAGDKAAFNIYRYSKYFDSLVLVSTNNITFKVKK